MEKGPENQILKKNELDLLLSATEKVSKIPAIYTESTYQCAKAFCEICSEILKKHEELIALYHSKTDKGFKNLREVEDMILMYNKSKDNLRSRIEINIKQISNAYYNHVSKHIEWIMTNYPSTKVEIEDIFKLIRSLGTEIVTYINDRILRNLNEYVVQLKSDSEYYHNEIDLGKMNRRRLEFEKSNRKYRNELQILVDRLRDLILQFSKYGKIDICLN